MFLLFEAPFTLHDMESQTESLQICLRFQIVWQSQHNTRHAFSCLYPSMAPQMRCESAAIVVWQQTVPIQIAWSRSFFGATNAHKAAHWSDWTALCDIQNCMKIALSKLHSGNTCSRYAMMWTILCILRRVDKLSLSTSLPLALACPAWILHLILLMWY